MYSADELKKLQGLQLKIAKEFKRICDKYQISYSLSGGSLLGAIRHTGFIPWDDDFDVEMLRSEYERFLKIAPVELKDDYFLETWGTDKYFSLPYAKLMLKGTTYAEENTQNAKIRKGIFIDIFVADSISDKNWFRHLQCSICDNLGGVICKKNHYTDQSTGGKKILYTLLTFFPLKCLQKLLIFFMTVCNQSVTKDTAIFTSCYGAEKEIKSKEFYKDLTEYIFEDTHFKGFTNYNVYLQSLYGNYMEFPPEEERYNRHGIIKIDCGNY